MAGSCNEETLRYRAAVPSQSVSSELVNPGSRDLAPHLWGRVKSRLPTTSTWREYPGSVINEDGSHYTPGANLIVASRVAESEQLRTFFGDQDLVQGIGE